MSTRRRIAAIAATAALFVGAAAAQHDQHQAEPGAPPEKAGAGGTHMMMAQMPHMMAGHDEIVKLAEKLQNSFAAIEAEKDPAALKAKLDEHGALLKELRVKLQAHAQMMNTVMGGEHGKK
jgi:hypothetical protein